MILVKNFYDRDTFIAISEEGCSLVPSGNLNCSTRGVGAFLPTGELIVIFVHSRRIYFQYNEFIYPLDEYDYYVSNSYDGQGTREFTFELNNEKICSVTYSEYVTSGYFPHNSHTDDFLIYITEILHDSYSIKRYINEIETLNDYYGT